MMFLQKPGYLSSTDKTLFFTCSISKNKQENFLLKEKVFALFYSQEICGLSPINLKQDFHFLWWATIFNIIVQISLCQSVIQISLRNANCLEENWKTNKCKDSWKKSKSKWWQQTICLTKSNNSVFNYWQNSRGEPFIYTIVKLTDFAGRACEGKIWVCILKKGNFSIQKRTTK